MRQAVNAGGTQRFVSLDALRGICAILVCLFHFQAAGYLTQNPLVRNSWVFVDFFFVLSGFVLAHSYGPRLIAGMKVGAFTGLRFMRLYPLHLVMLLLFVLVEILGSLFLGSYMERPDFSGHTSVYSLVLNIFMLHCFGLYETLSWNHPSWSIAAEFWTYILYGIIVVFSTRYIKSISAIIAAASLLFLFLFSENGINTTWQFGMIRCTYGFFLGVLGHAYWRARGAPTDRLPKAARGAAELLALLMVGVLIAFFADGLQSLLLPPVFLVVVLVFSGAGGALNALLVQPGAMRLGTWSYGIYMVHTFVQGRMDDLLRVLHGLGGPNLLSTVPETGQVLIGRNALEGDIATVAMLVLVVLFAALLYKLVELPGIRIGNTLFRPRT